MFFDDIYEETGTVCTDVSAEVISLAEFETGQWLEADAGEGRKDCAEESFPDVVVVRYDIEGNADEAAVENMEAELQIVTDELQMHRMSGMFESNDYDDSAKFKRRNTPYYAFVIDWIRTGGPTYFARTWTYRNTDLPVVVEDVPDFESGDDGSYDWPDIEIVGEDSIAPVPRGISTVNDEYNDYVGRSAAFYRDVGQV